MPFIVLFTFSAVLFFGCNKAVQKSFVTVEQAPFGVTDAGDSISVFTITSSSGMKAKIINYGAIITALETPDKAGQIGDIVLGYDNLPDYVANTTYFGAVVGRYGNRIREGKFELNGQEYQLTVNDGKNHLHGGKKGFNKVVWTPTIVQKQDTAGVALFYSSPDGEEGYPGTFNLTVTYLITTNNELIVDYKGVTDKPTIVNPTHHSYFNLAGQGNGTILDHQLQLFADHFTPVDNTLIPTGEIRSVDGTPFDFRTPTAIGARINADNEQIKFGFGYDHNWVLNKQPGTLSLAARVTESTTGRVMEVYTTEPGIQFYAGNFLDGTITGKEGKVYPYRSGFCLEAQHYPDSPNEPSFPSVVLNPGETYTQTTIYKFYAQQ